MSESSAKALLTPVFRNACGRQPDRVRLQSILALALPGLARGIARIALGLAIRFVGEKA